MKSPGELQNDHILQGKCTAVWQVGNEWVICHKKWAKDSTDYCDEHNNMIKLRNKKIRDAHRYHKVDQSDYAEMEQYAVPVERVYDDELPF